MTLARVALAANAADSMPKVSSWHSTTHVLTGWDGTPFVLSNYGIERGVFLTRGGLTGMGIPPLTRWTTESPATNGVTFQGAKVAVRDVSMPIFIWDETGTNSFLEWEDSFFSALDPMRPVTWTVATPLSSRSLTMRLIDDGGYSESLGASRFGWERYVLHFQAEDQPMWVATDTQPVTWGTGDIKPFFGGVPGGFGPPFFIADAERIGPEMTITNRGDLDTWSTWSLAAGANPIDDFGLTVGGVTVSLAVSVPAGQTWTIDTRPENRGLFDASGNFVPGGLKQANFGAIPAGTDVPLNMATSALDCTVTATFQELFYRARGGRGSTADQAVGQTSD